MFKQFITYCLSWQFVMAVLNMLDWRGAYRTTTNHKSWRTEVWTFANHPGKKSRNYIYNAK